MNILGFDDVYLTRDQQRLLGGWSDILDDTRHLCRSLNALPDACTCGQGASNLSGACTCCHRTGDDTVPGCPDCDRLLARIRPAIDALTVDTFRFFPIVKDLLKERATDLLKQVDQLDRKLEGPQR